MATSREQIGEVEVDGVTRPIEIDWIKRRFEIVVGDNAAVLLFHAPANRLILIHTEISEALRGRGLADVLARAALEYARAHEKRVEPVCPVVQRYLTKHPEYLDLIETDA